MKITPLIVAALMLSTSVLAEVNPRNGSFSLTFRELPVEQEGSRLSLRRTFNSMAASKGWFGRGWGSRFETRLVAMPDHSIVVQDNGTGPKTSYFGDRFDLQEGVAKILTAAMVRSSLSTSATADLARQLLDSDEARFRMVREMELPVEIKPQQVFRTDSCSDGSVTRTDTGFSRLTCNGSKETFDATGRLTSALDSDGYGFDIEYQNGRAHRIVDTHGQTLRLAWSASGFLQGATHGTKEVGYEQDAAGNLMVTKDERDTKYVYSYDDFHNLKKVTFLDASTIEVDYQDAPSGQVHAVKDRLGNKIFYEYSTDPEDAQHTFTRVTKVPFDKTQETSISEFEFNDNDHRLAERKSLPALLGMAVASSNTLHDAKGRTKRKADAKGNLFDVVYHPDNDKIIMVFAPKVFTEVRYSDEALLEQIIVRTGKGRVTLDYLPSGKLMGMAAGSSRDPESIRAVAMALQNLVELQK